MKKRILAFVLCAAMIFALAACGSTTATSPTQNPTATQSVEENPSDEPETIDLVTVAMTTSMGDLGPFAFSTVGRNNLRYFCYEHLVTFTEFGQSWDEMEKQIAKEITQIDPKTYQVEIYDYVVDAIGNPVKASDIAFCFNTLAESGVSARYTGYLDSVTVIDDNTVEIKVSSDLIGVIEYCMWLVQIVSEKTYNEYKDTMMNTPITTGPYQVTECVEGSYYTITKNENYWQKEELRNFYAQQPIDTIKYLVVTESSQATIALQTGEVDLITSVNNSEMSYFLNADGTAADGYSVSYAMQTSPISLLFNMAEGADGDMFRDNLALRQAICYGINVDDIISIGCNGYAVKSYDLATAECGDFNPKWEEEDYYDYDLDKAKSLAADAGYADGKKDGKQVTIRLLTSTAYSAAAQVVQSQLMDLGFAIELNCLDDAMFNEYLQNSSTWDLLITKKGTEGYLAGVYDGMLIRNSKGVGTFNFLVDDELEELLQTAHNVETHSEESIDALHYYVKDNAIAYGLYNLKAFSVGREGIDIFQYPMQGFLVPNCCTYN